MVLDNYDSGRKLIFTEGIELYDVEVVSNLSNRDSISYLVRVLEIYESALLRSRKVGDEFHLSMPRNVGMAINWNLEPRVRENFE